MANPSPSVEVKNGAAAYVTAVGGVDITPTNTIVIRLASTADVDAWLIDCLTTDDLSDKDTVTASLVIDTTLRTATFTAPAAGRTYRFRSRVNSGLDRNGVAQPTYTTTFCLYTVKNGRRKWAVDETTEGNATFGYITQFNALIDSVASGSGNAVPAGVNYQAQYYDGGAFAGATGMNYVPTAGVAEFNRGLRVIGTAVATLANAMLVAGTGATGFNLVQPVMLAPIIGGTAVFTGTDMAVYGLSDHRPVSAVRNLTTTNATITPVYAFKPIDEAVTNVVVEANAVPSGGAAGGSYVRRVMIRMDGGVGTCGTHESSWDSEHTASGVGFTGISQGSGIWIGVSGATGFVNVRGTATGSIKWGVTITHQSTSWA